MKCLTDPLIIYQSVEPPHRDCFFPASNQKLTRSEKHAWPSFYLKWTSAQFWPKLHQKHCSLRPNLQFCCRKWSVGIKSYLLISLKRALLVTQNIWPNTQRGGTIAITKTRNSQYYSPQRTKDCESSRNRTSLIWFHRRTLRCYWVPLPVLACFGRKPNSWINMRELAEGLRAQVK